MTTVAGEAAATTLADGLVASHLAACVNCLAGATSFYFWKGELQREAEVVMLIKSHREKLDRIESYFKEHHPYEIPEFLVLDIAALSSSYRNWLNSELNLSR